MTWPIFYISKILNFLLLHQLYNIYFQSVAIIFEKIFLHQNVLWFINFPPQKKTGERFFLKMTLRHFWFGQTVEKNSNNYHIDDC